MANNTIETCANCGRIIGKLETPMVWNDHIVCRGCREALTAEREAPQERTTAEGHPAVREPREVLSGDTVLDATARMPDYRAAPSLQDLENAARRGTPGLSPKAVKNATFRAGWKNLLFPITGFAIVAAVLAGMRLWTSASAQRRLALDKRAYFAFEGSDGTHSGAAWRHARTLLARAMDGGKPDAAESWLIKLRDEDQQLDQNQGLLKLSEVGTGWSDKPAAYANAVQADCSVALSYRIKAGKILGEYH